MSLFGGFLLGGTNTKKKGDHRNKIFLQINLLKPNCIKGGTSGSIETACTFEGVFQCGGKNGAPEREFCLKQKNV